MRDLTEENGFFDHLNEAFARHFKETPNDRGAAWNSAVKEVGAKVMQMALANRRPDLTKADFNSQEVEVAQEERDKHLIFAMRELIDAANEAKLIDELICRGIEADLPARLVDEYKNQYRLENTAMLQAALAAQEALAKVLVLTPRADAAPMAKAFNGDAV